MPKIKCNNFEIFCIFLSIKIINMNGKTTNPNGKIKKGGNKKEHNTPQKNNLLIVI